MKKKKRSIHIRKIRERSDNKFVKKSIEHFHTYFKIYFSKKIKKNFSLCSFLLCFKAINLAKIINLFKNFGLNKFYAINNNLNIDLILIVLKKKYDILKFNKAIKNFNVQKKKNLFIHVSYRHYLRLPVRGQRTKTNAKTRKHYAII